MCQWLFVSGTGTQEEMLFRRSNYSQTLKHGMGPVRYPLADGGGVYSPAVTVFMHGPDKGYAPMQAPFEAAFIAAAAEFKPQLVKGRLGDASAQRTKQKISFVVRCAAFHQHHCLVLGAFGCGAFSNPPQHVAELFGQVLSEPTPSGLPLKAHFSHIVFAIAPGRTGKHNPIGNFAAFRGVLDPMNLAPANTLPTLHRRDAVEADDAAED